MATAGGPLINSSFWRLYGARCRGESDCLHILLSKGGYEENAFGA